MADIEMPQLGETVTEGTITRWFKNVGDSVARDEVLFEVSTDKVDSQVPSTAAGVISEILVAEGDTVEVGAVLARIGDSAEPQQGEPVVSAPLSEPAEPQQSEPVVSAPLSEPAEPQQSEPVVSAPLPEPADQGVSGEEPLMPNKVLSPVVRRLIAEYEIDANQIQGSGLGGRISRDDVQRYIEQNQLSQNQVPKISAAAAGAATAGAATAGAVGQRNVVTPAAQPPVIAGAKDQVVPLSNIRLRTAEHMVMSKSVAPHTLTAIEVDYERVEHVRSTYGAGFKQDEGFSLTYLPFIARATIDALREYPHLNASVGDRELVVFNQVNLGIAVDLDFQGLLAPVVRGADGKRLRSIARDIIDLAERARSKQLSPDELADGTFTITNAGSYGTMMQFPIINQPQVAILSTDAIKRKPVVIEDDYGNESISIHSMGVLAMAWDHRAIDGAYAAAFLARIKEIIETRDWEAELS